MIKLTEKDKLTDILMFEKDIIKNYSSLITEASCQGLRTVFKEFHDETSDDQFDVYDCMNKRNYYNPKQAEATAIKQQKATFETMKTQLQDLNK